MKNSAHHIFAIIFLFFCVFIYVFYRTEDTLINLILLQLLPNSELLLFKETIRSTVAFPAWVIYSLPGGLWVFAASILARKLRLRIFSKNICIEWAPMFFALWLEFWQYVGIVKGHFDVLDILIVLIFGLTAMSVKKPMQLSTQTLFPFHKRSTIFVFVFVCVFLGHVFA